MRDIERLTYTNERGDSIELSPRSAYHVNFKDVKGLSDVKNEIYSSSSMGQDGSTYLGYRIEKRDIDIDGYITERDKNAVLSLRRNMNRVLNPQYNGKLIYQLGSYKRVIECKLEDAPIFSRKSLLTKFSINLVCLNPFWHDESEKRENIASWIGSFSFPINLRSGWRIGYREPSLIVNVHNAGDVKSGIRIDFKAIGTVTNPRLMNVNTQEFMQLNCTMQAGDVLSVSTGYGEKGATLTRNGVKTDAFRNIDVDSSYLQIDVGDNLFRYSAASNEENLEVYIYHTDKYLGV